MRHKYLGRTLTRKPQVSDVVGRTGEYILTTMKSSSIDVSESIVEIETYKEALKNGAKLFFFTHYDTVDSDDTYLAEYDHKHLPQVGDEVKIDYRRGKILRSEFDARHNLMIHYTNINSHIKGKEETEKALENARLEMIAKCDDILNRYKIQKAINEARPQVAVKKGFFDRVFS